MSSHSSFSARVNGNPQALLGDKVMLAAIGLSAGAAVLIGYFYFELTLAVVGAAVMILASNYILTSIFTTIGL